MPSTRPSPSGTFRSNIPVNVAYEAATADLDDRNIIDPWHLEAYGEVTVNYNRDVETFPVLKAMMEKIAGESPYQSPTDMGVNMVGLCISDDEVCREAAKNEIVRRHFADRRGDARVPARGPRLWRRLNCSCARSMSPATTRPPTRRHSPRRRRREAPPAAMVLPDGKLVTGKTSELMGAAASLLLNAAKHMAGIPKKTYVVSEEALVPICHLKTDHLRSHNPRLHSDEMLIALSLSSATNDQAEATVDALEQLAGCDAYFSVIISEADMRTYRNLGINVCCEPKYERQTLLSPVTK